MGKLDSSPRILAAGGLLWRDETRREIAIIHRHRYDDWGLPKGKLDAGETIEACARREVQEETGYRPAVIGYAGELFYRVEDREKSVLFWHMTLADATVGETDANEVSTVEWMDVESALTRLSYADERELVARSRGD